MLLIAPPIKQQFFGADGNPLVGGKLRTMAAGTETNLPVYQDAAGTVPHANPIILNSRGEVTYFLGDAPYKFRLLTSTDVEIYTVDNVVSATASAEALRADLSGTTAGKGAAMLGFLQSGVGAIPRTALAKMREAFTPDDIGCVGDGVADDGAAFGAALALAVATGRVLSLRPGAIYKLVSYTAFSNNAPLTIVGNGATIQGPAGAVDFLSPAAGFTVTGVRFTGWRGIVNRLTAQSGSMDEVRFDNNRVTACTGICFNMERPIDRFWIERNIFEDCTGGYGVRIGDNIFANQDTWSRGWVCENIFKNQSGTGSVSAVAILIYGREVTISGNKIDGVTQTGSGESWGIYTKVRFGQVTNNVVRNVTSAFNADLVGINIKGLTRGVTASPQGYANIVTGNHVMNIGVVGSSGTGIRAQTDDVLISLNICEDCGGTSLAADETAVHRNVAISHNLASYSTLTVGTVGVRIEGAGTGDSVDNNKVTNASTGIVARTGPTGTMADARMLENQLFGCTNNIVFDSFPGCTLSRLAIDGNVVSGGLFGVLFNGSAGTVTGLRLRNNDLFRASTPVLGSLGTSPLVYGNTGFLSASSTWNPPSIATGSSTATTVIVDGAVVGDTVAASFSNALVGASLTAQVSAAGTVEARLTNNSGADVDLNSGTVRVIVSKGL